MKIFYLYSRQMAEICEKVFIPSLTAVEPTVELHGHYFDVEGDGNYQSEGWHRSIMLKNLLLMEAIAANEGEVIGFLDVDIVCLQPFVNEALDCLGEASMAAQRETEVGGLNSGCMFLKCTHVLRDCFVAVLRRYAVDCREKSQNLFAEELQKAGVEYRLLPTQFSNETNGGLHPKSVLYHANLTTPGHQSSVELKTRHLSFAKRCFNFCNG